MQRRLLALQETAGNVATRSLLLRAPKPAPAGAPAKAPSVLKDAGLKTTTTIDGKIAGLLQSALLESVVLKPYLKESIVKTVADKAFTIHGSDEEFEYRYAKLHDIKDSPAAVAKKVENVRGFFHRATKSIHLRPSANVGEALHEAVHKVSSAGFRGFFGGFLDEGVTQYFSNEVLREQGLDQMKTPLYESHLSCATRLVKFTSPDLVARAYFNAPMPLVEALQTKLKLDIPALRKLANDGGLCDRLPK